MIDRTNLGLLRSECLLKVAPNDTRGLGSVDSGPKSLALVVPDHRASLRVEGCQTLTERIDIIVGPLDQRLAGHVIGHRLLWWAALPVRQRNGLKSGNETDLNSLWYDRPLAGWIKRPVIREMRSWSAIDSSTTLSNFSLRDSSMESSFSAWGTVRGKPSNTNL